MKEQHTTEVEKTLTRPEVHGKWERSYRTAENEKFVRLACDHAIRALSPPQGATFLDAGCGIGAHSIELAKRGYSVVAFDLYEQVLSDAQRAIEAAGLQDRITVRQENLRALSFDSETFDYIWCWGVLMHIPDLEAAVSELSRVLRKGGALIVSEGNMHSFDSVLLRVLKRVSNKGGTVPLSTPSGMEYWTQTPVGDLLTRHANVGWLINLFRSHKLVVENRRAGEFTEMYTRFSFPPLATFLHSFNRVWFRLIMLPHPAFGNLLILRKEG